MMIGWLLRFGLIFALMPTFSLEKTTLWTVQTQCAAPPVKIALTDQTYSGVIVSQILTDAVRGLRSEIGKTYYIAFAGSNFIEAGTLMGDWYAVPYGYIETVGLSNVYYRVNELRVHNTQTNAQIRARLPWRVTFQYPNLHPIKWLDAETLLVPAGNPTDGWTWHTLKPFEADAAANATPSPLGDYTLFSPDQTRGIAPYADGWALYDLTTDTQLQTYPATMQFLSWSSQSDQLAAYDTRTRELLLYREDTDSPEVVLTLTADQRLWNFRWSPVIEPAAIDQARFALNAYDPYNEENTLYLGDTAAHTLTDPCIQLIPQHDGNPHHVGNAASGLAWSPDGTQLALVTSNDATSSESVQIYDLASGERYAVGVYAGGLIGWGD